MRIEVKDLEGEKNFGHGFRNLYILNENSRGKIIINDNEQYNVEDVDLLEDVNVYKIRWRLDSLGTLTFFLSDAYLKIRKMHVLTVDADVAQKTLSERFSLNNTTPSHTSQLSGVDGKVRKVVGLILNGSAVGGSYLDVYVYLNLGTKDIMLYHKQYDLSTVTGDLIWINGDSNWGGLQIPSTTTFLGLLQNIELRSSQHALKIILVGSGTGIKGNYDVLMVYKEEELIT